MPLYRRHMRFLVGVPFTTSLSLDAVERHRNDEMISYCHYCNVLGEELYADTELIKWKGHRCYLHIYYDSIKAVLDEKKFSHRILTEYEELCSGSTVKEHQKDYERFFIVKETPKRGRKVEYNQEAIDAHRKNSVGWFVLATGYLCRSPAYVFPCLLLSLTSGTLLFRSMERLLLHCVFCSKHQ